MSKPESNQTSHPAMDMNEHNSTFHGFVEVSKTGSVACINALVTLAFVYKQMPILATLFLIALLVTSAIGLMMKNNGWVPGGVVMALGLIGMAVL